MTVTADRHAEKELVALLDDEDEWVRRWAATALGKLTGSASEWSSDWWQQEHGTRLVLGGSWAQARPDLFRLYGGYGLLPEQSGGDSASGRIAWVP